MSQETWLPDTDRVIRVMGPITDLLEMDGKIPFSCIGRGYTDEDGHIWIYMDKRPNQPNKKPYLWFVDNDGTLETIFSDPDEKMRELYQLKNTVDLSKTAISANTKEDEVLYNEQAIYDMNAKAEIFTPEEKEADDFLKQVVKRTLINKHTDTSRLKHKTKEKYSLPNMITSLQSETKMSTLYFNIWSEIAGFDFIVAAYDNGSDIDTLKDPVIYVSRSNKLYTIALANLTLIDSDGRSSELNYESKELMEKVKAQTETQSRLDIGDANFLTDEEEE